VSRVELPWAVQVSRTDSCEALDRLMDVWYAAMTAAGGIQSSIGFDGHMGRRDWEGAKGSIVRTHGRSNPDHQSTLDTLSAAIYQRKMLGHRSRSTAAVSRKASGERP
jgi:hypothetical protein